MTTITSTTVTPHPFTPERSYPFRKREDGTFHVPLSPSCKKTKGFIYRIKNHDTDTSYVGKFSGTFARNVSRYVSNVNNEAKDPTKFGDDVRAGHQFSIGILHVIQEDEDINEEEAWFIFMKGLSEDLYNVTRGKNGSRPLAVSKDIQKIPSEKMDAVFRKVYQSPERKVSFRTTSRKKNHAHITLARADLSGPGVYKITQVTDIGRKVEYVGKAANVQKRLSTHTHYANHPNKKNVRGTALYDALNTSSNQFYVSKIDIESIQVAAENEFGLRPAKEDIEASAIRVLQTIEHGYNRVAGSSVNVQNSTQSTRRKLFK